VKHARSFRVRYEECSLDGSLKGAVYLRMMQETAFDASAAAGYGQARYREIERTWLIRRTDLELLLPVVYGDELQVTTWVADFHRVRSIRAYEFHRQGLGDLVARAYTDWVFIDTSSGRPVSIPPEVTDAYHAQPDERMAALRQPFPCPPLPASGAYTEQRQVAWNDLDPVQHVNNAVYLAYIEDCTRRAADAQGYSPRWFSAEGLLLKPLRHQIEYRLPAVWGDGLSIATWVSAAGKDSFERCFILQRSSDGESIARAVSHYRWVEAASGLSSPLPVDFARSLSAGLPEMGS